MAAADGDVHRNPQLGQVAAALAADRPAGLGEHRAAVERVLARASRIADPAQRSLFLRALPDNARTMELSGGE